MLFCQNQCQITGIVTEPVTLFVGRFMLFINDYNPQIFKGCENCRSGADDDYCFATPDSAPFIISLSI
jgi:hypothetical protein